MRIFEDFTTALEEIERDLVKFGNIVHSDTFQNKFVKGDKDYDTLELQGHTFCITDPETIKPSHPEWAQKEFNERIDAENHPINPGNAWKLREDYWKHFFNSDGKFDYSYNERIAPQLWDIIRLLLENPETRQAIISVYWPSKDLNTPASGKRIPCSIYYNFQIRDGALDVLYNMRSSDFYKHFQNDVCLASWLREYIKRMLLTNQEGAPKDKQDMFKGLESGKTIVNIDSLHAYRRDAPSKFEKF